MFTNTNQETPYLQALINGININGMLSSGSGCCSNIDAISGGILMPYNKNNPATVTTGNGVAGYADNDCETGESGNHCNVTGGFFYGRASANGAYAWGINPVVTDLNENITGHGLFGMEIDMNGNGTPTAFVGIDLLGTVSSSFVMPSTAVGIQVFAPALPPPSGGNVPWPVGMVFAQAATTATAIQFYPTCALVAQGGGTCNSQQILFTSQNTSAPGNHYYLGSVYLDEDGNLALNPQTGEAAKVSGNLTVSGSLSVSGTKNFKIDHPLDPANKYLYHTSVESPDMKNIYDGVAILNDSGEAEVQLPDWFEALNHDFRYQLTCLGAFAPVYIRQEIQNNSFRIGGGTPGLKVSWQVTGIRHDAYAKAHQSPVEEEKPAAERGHYLHPELFGASVARQVGGH